MANGNQDFQSFIQTVLGIIAQLPALDGYLQTDAVNLALQLYGAYAGQQLSQQQLALDQLRVNAQIAGINAQSAAAKLSAQAQIEQARATVQAAQIRAQADLAAVKTQGEYNLKIAEIEQLGAMERLLTQLDVQLRTEIAGLAQQYQLAQQQNAFQLADMFGSGRLRDTLSGLFLQAGIAGQPALGSSFPGGPQALQAAMQSLGASFGAPLQYYNQIQGIVGGVGGPGRNAFGTSLGLPGVDGAIKRASDIIGRPAAVGQQLGPTLSPATRALEVFRNRPQTVSTGQTSPFFTGQPSPFGQTGVVNPFTGQNVPLINLTNPFQLAAGVI